MSKVQKLDSLMSRDFDAAAGAGPWVPLPDVIALGIGPYSRRFQDLRKLYAPLGFDVENRVERGSDGVTRSWYRKVRVGYPQAERPETSFGSSQTHKTRRPGWEVPISSFSAEKPSKSWDEIVADRERKLSAPKTFELVP
jgi:hypothetical protein